MKDRDFCPRGACPRGRGQSSKTPSLAFWGAGVKGCRCPGGLERKCPDTYLPIISPAGEPDAGCSVCWSEPISYIAPVETVVYARGRRRRAAVLLREECDVHRPRYRETFLRRMYGTTAPLQDIRPRTPTSRKQPWQTSATDFNRNVCRILVSGVNSPLPPGAKKILKI